MSWHHLIFLCYWIFPACTLLACGCPRQDFLSCILFMRRNRSPCSASCSDLIISTVSWPAEIFSDSYIYLCWCLFLYLSEKYTTIFPPWLATCNTESDSCQVHTMSSTLIDTSAYFENIFKIFNYVHSRVTICLKFFGATL